MLVHLARLDKSGAVEPVLRDRSETHAFVDYTRNIYARIFSGNLQVFGARSICYSVGVDSPYRKSEHVVPDAGKHMSFSPVLRVL